ncbi:hypothetical protein BS47DRAFT_1350697, partial [Hydnum rufescens UP504]
MITRLQRRTHERQCAKRRYEATPNRMNPAPTIASVWVCTRLSPQPPAKQAPPPANESRKRDPPRHIRQMKPGNGNARRKTAGTPDVPHSRFGGSVVIL